MRRSCMRRPRRSCKSAPVEWVSPSWAGMADRASTRGMIRSFIVLAYNAQADPSGADGSAVQRCDRVNDRASGHLDLDQFLAVRIADMDGAGDARIEAVDGAQDFDRLLGIVHGMAFE